MLRAQEIAARLRGDLDWVMAKSAKLRAARESWGRWLVAQRVVMWGVWALAWVLPGVEEEAVERADESKEHG